jgi:2,3-bisphosphoglycerate-dependent phosphoglycerate mutase
LAARLGLPVTVETDLRERRLSGDPITAGDFEAAVRQTWATMEVAHPGGETNEAAAARGAAVIRRLQAHHPGAHIVVGTHGNLLALILHHFDATIDFEFWRGLSMPDIYRLSLEGDGVVEIDRLWSRTGEASGD